MFPEEGVKSDENASDLENIVESKKSFCSAVLVSSPRTSRVSSPTRNLSITGDRVFTNSNHAKKSIDMRPLSVPPRNIKRNSSKQSYCYVALGIATIVVCGIAFTMWLTYDSLEKFISSMLN
ncbi:unnamed protein product [Acanthocheilonema viteae]|uniref:Uncharacterized protein n=1 Tax=Acanthocheilonema viteae TaxID=6277 RepID=A0A498SBA3_ACAVI|nr:unnamed protein product [Acanthocheilonema viteae]